MMTAMAKKKEAGCRNRQSTDSLRNDIEERNKQYNDTQQKTVSMVTLRIATRIIMKVSIVTISITTVTKVLTYTIMTLRITTHSITKLSTMTYSVMTISSTIKSTI